MEILEAIRARHSVRSYTDQKIEGNTLTTLQAEISKCNAESGLQLQLITEEPNAFSGKMAHYGQFRNVKNYIALVGKKESATDEKVGYYGERVVLAAAMLGLNTCWVALSFSKSKTKCRVQEGEKLFCVISVGYGETQGAAHKNKPMQTLCKVDGVAPEWFRKGMEAALLAPTAVNQQKFLFTCLGDTVKAESRGGFYSKMDLGIVKYHFELGAGTKNFKWA